MESSVHQRVVPAGTPFWELTSGDETSGYVYTAREEYDPLPTDTEKRRLAKREAAICKWVEILPAIEQPPEVRRYMFGKTSECLNHGLHVGGLISSLRLYLHPSVPLSSLGAPPHSRDSVELRGRLWSEYVEKMATLPADFAKLPWRELPFTNFAKCCRRIVKAAGILKTPPLQLGTVDALPHFAVSTNKEGRTEIRVPSRTTLQRIWGDRMRIGASEGVASDREFIRLYAANHTAISSGSERLHDLFGHFLSQCQWDPATRELFRLNVERIQRLLAGLRTSDDGLSASARQLGLNLTQVKQIEWLVAALVDSDSSAELPAEVQSRLKLPVAHRLTQWLVNDGHRHWEFTFYEKFGFPGAHGRPMVEQVIPLFQALQKLEQEPSPQTSGAWSLGIPLGLLSAGEMPLHALQKSERTSPQTSGPLRVGAIPSAELVKACIAAVLWTIYSNPAPSKVDIAEVD